jgi:hypothetical protein
MKNVSIAVGIAVMLAACGGGGGDSTGSAPVASSSGTPAPTSTTTTTPPAASSTTTTTPTSQKFTPPTPPSSAVKFTTSSINEGNTSSVDVVTFRAAVDMTVAGKLNSIWVSANQAGGKATVSGDQNTIVFMPGVGAQVTVTGTSNTFYVPSDGTVTITGSGAASSTIRNYTP